MHDLGLALLLMSAPAAGDMPPVAIAMQIVERRIIIRIPMRRSLRRPRGSAEPAVQWSESEASDCQPARQIARARFTRPGVVDFLMRDRRVIRARLDSDCVNLGYYSAFYLVPGEDGRICVERDLVQSRAGGQCAISNFHTLRATPTN